MIISQEEKDLRMAFYQIEKLYRPMFDLFTDNQIEFPEYKGSLTIDSYLCYQPDILILGYNPGHGKYHDWSKDGAHLVYTGERPLGIFEWGNANKDGAWYEMRKPVNNSYPKNILEFIYKFASIQGWGEGDYITRPKWSNKIERRIMLMNLYPFGTEDVEKLHRLFSKIISQAKDLYDNKFDDEWAVRRFLLYKLHHFVENNVKPKAILCLGRSTISDYTWGQFGVCKYEGIFVGNNYRNVVGISRSGTWTDRARNAAKVVSEII